MIAKFLDEVDYALSNVHGFIHLKNLAILTGVSAKSIIEQASGMVMKRYPKVKINVYSVHNDFFGDSVTVTGLVTATDIINQYGGKIKEDCVVIPSVMLKEFGDVFLDDTDFCEFQKKMKKKIVVSSTTGEGFVKAVLRGVSLW